MPKSTINHIYKRYQIMPDLQIHQLRVTGVAQIICQHLHDGVDVEQDQVITACLLHDIGNIIKFDLKTFPEFCQPEGIAYWQKVKDEFIEKYGPNEHQASLAISKKLGVSEKVLQYIGAVGFSKAKENLATKDYGQKICAYSDMRVGPFGVVPLEKRFDDLRTRYQKKYAGSEHEAQRTVFEDGLRQIEQQLQKVTTIDLHQITDQAVNDTIENLKKWHI